tara:strand:+ start:421 stop:597 length:177 start_codon:yes stop_codon:yes gene_type:complete
MNYYQISKSRDKKDIKRELKAEMKRLLLVRSDLIDGDDIQEVVNSTKDFFKNKFGEQK